MESPLTAALARAARRLRTATALLLVGGVAIAAIGRGLPLVIIAPQFAVDLYSLLTVPSVKTWSDLKGKSIILGTKEDVTAISLAQLAAQHGLKMDDFDILVAGSTPARYAALLSGNVQGAMLLQPFDLLAEAKGMNVLGSAADVMKNWAFTSLIANTGWLAKNGPLAVKFLRAVRRGIEYGYAHQDEAVKVLVAAAHVDPGIAAEAYQLDFVKRRAWDPNFKLTAAALQTVGKYQIQFGVIKTMPPVAKLYDGTYAAQDQPIRRHDVRRRAWRSRCVSRSPRREWSDDRGSSRRWRLVDRSIPGLVACVCRDTA